MKTFKIVNGNHTKKTAAFARACIAYCYITIPAMEDVVGRLYLYLLSGLVALQNQALPQADSLFRSAITLIQDVPTVLEVDSQVKTSEDSLVSYLQYFSSLLVVIPGHPEYGPFYLIKGLLKVIQDYPWEKGSNGKLRIFIGMLQSFAALGQQTLPLHIPKVESNDTLYGCTQDYLEELHSIIDKLLEEILEQVNVLKDDPDRGAQKLQAKVTLDLFNETVSLTDLNSKSATFAAGLYNLAKKTGVSDNRYLESSLASLEKRKGNALYLELYKKLA